MNTQSQIQLTPELFQSTISLVTDFWTRTKLFSTKSDKQQMLVLHSKESFATLINTKYPIGEAHIRLEDIYGKQFAKDVITESMQNLLTK